jgi:hypothetical protein
MAELRLASRACFAASPDAPGEARALFADIATKSQDDRDTMGALPKAK